MFTGIIKELGCVKSVVKGANVTKIEIEALALFEETSVSDSIAVNGVCLTVVTKEKKTLVFEAVAPTMNISNLKRLRSGSPVNLEAALKTGQKLGGHFVLGHVDAEVKLRRSIRIGEYRKLEIDLPATFRRFLLEKGSVALDGVSLTVKKIYPRYFCVDVIPFTYEHTNLKYRKPGDWLNVEFDQLVKKS